MAVPVSVQSNPVHPTRDMVILTDPWTSAEVTDAARNSPRPLSARAIPGTEKHAKLLAAGATVYQQCPPLEVDAATPEISRWCDEHAVLPVRPLDDGVDLLETWTTWYEVIHRGWSPTAPRDQLLGSFAFVVPEIDASHSVGCWVDDELVAAAFVFSDDLPPEIVTEALLPDHPQAREAVGSCMAAVLRGAAGVVRFDGHVTDPHFAPLWASVPGVYVGDDDPMDLLEIVNS